MRYTDLARELATELDAPAEEVLSDLMSAMHAHGWPLDLTDDQAVLARLAVGDRVDQLRRLSDDDRR